MSVLTLISIDAFIRNLQNIDEIRSNIEIRGRFFDAPKNGI